MSRLTNDVESINQVLSGSVTQIVSGVLSAVGIAIAMLILNPTLGAVSLSTVALLTLIVNRVTSARTAESFRAQQTTLGTLNGLVEEIIGGQRVSLSASSPKSKATANSIFAWTTKPTTFICRRPRAQSASGRPFG